MKNRGDWPFKGGTLTFRDIYDMYKCHLRGKLLYIVSDCCYSGCWVRECASLLDKERICCGHDAEKHKIYLKVFATCLPSQQSTDTLYSSTIKSYVESRTSNSVAFPQHLYLQDDQTTFGFDFTSTSKCTLNEQGECLSSNKSTWEQDLNDLLTSPPNDDYLL